MHQTTYLKDGNDRPKQGIKVFPFAATSRSIRHHITELTPKQIHSEDAATVKISPQMSTNT